MRKIVITLLICLIFPHVVFSMQPPSEAEKESYIKDGTYKERMEFATKNENHRSNLPAYGNETAKPDGGIGLYSNFFEQSHYLKSTGNVNMILIMVDFSDNRFAAGDEAKYRDLMNIEPNNQHVNFPYESLRAYYKRSSYGKLTINTDVYKYSVDATRQDYSNQFNNEDYPILGMVQDIVANVNRMNSIDFSKYDNNADGYIDGLSFVWTGKDEGWGSDIWWSMMIDGKDLMTSTVDGKTLRLFTWLCAQRHLSPTGNVQVVAHETGHILGLPDYYDYDEFSGPDGGTGHMDMMDSNVGDHNAFSKYALGWIDPDVVTQGKTVTLRASGDATPLGTGEARAVIVAKDSTADFCEFYLIEYRKRVGNDSVYSSDNEGVAIWHVKANHSGGEFLCDNSYTSYKLLSLVEADGQERIEDDINFDFHSSSGTLYKAGQSFGINTFPTSDRYGGVYTGVNVSVNSFTGNTASITINFFDNETMQPAKVSSFDRSSNTMSATAACMIFSSNIYPQNESLIKFTTSDGVSIGGSVRTYKNKAYFMPEMQLLPSEQYTLTVPQGTLSDSKSNPNNEASFVFETPEDGGVEMKTIRVNNTEGSIGECSTYTSDGKLLTASISDEVQSYEGVDYNFNLLLTVTNNGVVEKTANIEMTNPVGLIKSILQLSDGKYVLSYNIGNNYVLVKFDSNLVYVDEVPVPYEQTNNIVEYNGYIICFRNYDIAQYNINTMGLADTYDFSNDFYYINGGVKTSDGNLLVYGLNKSKKARVVKLNSSFGKVWTYDSTQSDLSEAVSVAETQGGYAMLMLADYVPNKAIFESKLYIEKLSGAGSLVSTSQSLGTTVILGYRIPQIVSDSDKNIYVSLYTNRTDEKPYCYRTDTGYYIKGFDSEVVKLTPSFDELWRRCLPGSVAPGSSPMLTGDGRLIMTGYDEENNCLMLHTLKDFESPEVLESYIIQQSNYTKVFAAVKNTSTTKPIKPLLCIGVFDGNNFQTQRIINISGQTDPLGIAPLSVQYEGTAENKVYLLDDIGSIKPLLFNNAD